MKRLTKYSIKRNLILRKLRWSTKVSTFVVLCTVSLMEMPEEMTHGLYNPVKDINKRPRVSISGKALPFSMAKLWK